MKDQIIYETITSLRQEGLRFSVDTIAERLHISKKTIYKHFPNKEALALALYQRYYADTLAQAHRLTAENSVLVSFDIISSVWYKIIIKIFIQLQSVKIYKKKYAQIAIASCG